MTRSPRRPPAVEAFPPACEAGERARLPRGVAAAGLLLAAAAPAHAQSLTLAGFPDTTFAVQCAPGATLPRQRLPATLLLHLPRDPGVPGASDSAQRARVERLHRALVPQLTLPPMAALPQPVPLRREGDPHGVVPGSGASVRLWPGSLRGDLDSVEVRSRGAWLGLADSLAAAVRRAASAAVAAEPGALAGWPDIAEVFLATTVPADGFPLGTVAVETIPLDTAATLVRRVAPEYPRKLLAAGVEGWVVLHFVVDADGRVVPRRGGEATGGPPEFEQAAWRGTLRSEFRPATAGGCRVPQAVAQPVRFQLEG